MKFKSILLTVCLVVLFVFSTLCPAAFWYKTYPVEPPLDCNGRTGEISLKYSGQFYLSNHTLYMLDTNYPSLGDWISHAGAQVDLADMNSSSVGTQQYIDASVSLSDMNSNSVNSSKIVDDTIVSADMSSSVLKVETVTVTGPNILTLYSSPKQLVAAPGTHNVIEFLGAMVFYDYAGAAYGDAAQNMTVKYTNGSGTAVSGTLSGTGFLTATSDRTAKLLPVAVAATASAGVENQPLVFVMDTQDCNDGVGSAAAGILRVKIAYRILPSGF